MNIDLVAKLKTKDEFDKVYKTGDELSLYKGKNLLYYSLTNKNLDSRYSISIFLIDKGIDISILNAENETTLHVLLAQVKHNLNQTVILCQKLIEMGVDINILDSQNRLALQYIVNMKHTDAELKPLYDLWFSQANIDLATKNKMGYSPLDLAKKLPFRTELVERMEAYV
ncbi:ankyrin repeat domain-containing protein [Listeria sp. FSL L7-1582]|uniref:ankyrin repeat domain-containing protein n=1 Tax=Listeria portnoyi TaxID=2713504 RepID=UPI00164E0543|nr:ankyrin repeat domain-containing protein [Listeria portnoyi]MBC6310993.1 ankyrin repeat domain-containing protein [Listeria portnoyi]